MVVGREFYFGAFREFEKIRAGIDVSGRLYYREIRLAILLVVDPLLRTDALLAAFLAGVLSKLRSTLLGWKQGLGCLPGVVVRPDLTFQQDAVETGLVRVALPHVAIEVVPARELVVAEAAGEPGARLPPRKPLLAARLAGAAAEGHGGLPEWSRVPVTCHAWVPL